MRRYLILFFLFMGIIFISCATQKFKGYEGVSTFAVVPIDYDVVADWIAAPGTGTPYYNDRQDPPQRYILVSVPPYLLTTTLIRTPNNMKGDTLETVIYFEVPTTIYIGYDINRAMNRPAWLADSSGWEAPGGSIVVTDEPASPLAIYKKNVSHGATVLGGNWSYPAIPGGSNYVIFYEPMPLIDVNQGDTLLIMCQEPPAEQRVKGYNVYLRNFAGTAYTEPVLSSQNILKTTYEGMAMDATRYVVEVDVAQYYLYLTAFNSTYQSAFSEDVIPLNVRPVDTIVPEAPKKIIIILENLAHGTESEILGFLQSIFKMQHWAAEVQ